MTQEIPMLTYSTHPEITRDWLIPQKERVA